VCVCEFLLVWRAILSQFLRSSKWLFSSFLLVPFLCMWYVSVCAFCFCRPFPLLFRVFSLLPRPSRFQHTVLLLLHLIIIYCFLFPGKGPPSLTPSLPFLPPHVYAFVILTLPPSFPPCQCLQLTDSQRRLPSTTQNSSRFSSLSPLLPLFCTTWHTLAPPNSLLLSRLS